MPFHSNEYVSSRQQTLLFFICGDKLLIFFKKLTLFRTPIRCRTEWIIRFRILIPVHFIICISGPKWQLCNSNGRNSPSQIWIKITKSLWQKFLWKFWLFSAHCLPSLDMIVLCNSMACTRQKYRSKCRSLKLAWEPPNKCANKCLAFY